MSSSRDFSSISSPIHDLLAISVGDRLMDYDGFVVVDIDPWQDGVTAAKQRENGQQVELIFSGPIVAYLRPAFA